MAQLRYLMHVVLVSFFELAIVVGGNFIRFCLLRDMGVQVYPSLQMLSLQQKLLELMQAALRLFWCIHLWECLLFVSFRCYLFTFASNSSVAEAYFSSVI